MQLEKIYASQITFARFEPTPVFIRMSVGAPSSLPRVQVKCVHCGVSSLQSCRTLVFVRREFAKTDFLGSRYSYLLCIGFCEIACWVFQISSGQMQWTRRVWNRACTGYYNVLGEAVIVKIMQGFQEVPKIVVLFCIPPSVLILHTFGDSPRGTVFEKPASEVPAHHVVRVEPAWLHTSEGGSSGNFQGGAPGENPCIWFM